jgi:polyphosphate kinase
VSENITVRSIVGRFLEHSRISYFENGGTPKVFVGSADWMQRNFFRRIEVVFPIEDPAIRDRIINQILATLLADNAKASFLGSDGNYTRRAAKKEEQRSSQAEFMALALGESKTRRTKAVAKRAYPKMQVAKHRD